MSILGILTCEILELEFAHLLKGDPDIERVTILEDCHSARLVASMESDGFKKVRRIDQMNAFTPGPSGHLEVFVRVLELALHNRKKTLQEGLMQAASEMGPYVDALLLGYGLCGNALEKPDELLSGTGVPIFIPMDEDHPVDDCVGLLIGGRKSYYEEQCKIAGTFFMIPGWSFHWKRMFEREFGNIGIAMAKRLFEHYERSLLVPTPTMSVREMTRNVKEFNDLFGFRTDVRSGTLNILEKTWYAAKEYVMKNSNKSSKEHL